MTDQRVAGPWTHDHFAEYTRLAGGSHTIDQLAEIMEPADAEHYRAWIDDDSTCCGVASRKERHHG